MRLTRSQSLSLATSTFFGLDFCWPTEDDLLNFDGLTSDLEGGGGREGGGGAIGTGSEAPEESTETSSLSEARICDRDKLS